MLEIRSICFLHEVIKRLPDLNTKHAKSVFYKFLPCGELVLNQDVYSKPKVQINVLLRLESDSYNNFFCSAFAVRQEITGLKLNSQIL